MSDMRRLIETVDSGTSKTKVDEALPLIGAGLAAGARLAAPYVARAGSAIMKGLKGTPKPPTTPPVVTPSGVTPTIPPNVNVPAMVRNRPGQPLPGSAPPAGSAPATYDTVGGYRAAQAAEKAAKQAAEKTAQTAAKPRIQRRPGETPADAIKRAQAEQGAAPAKPAGPTAPRPAGEKPAVWRNPRTGEVSSKPPAPTSPTTGPGDLGKIKPGPRSDADIPFPLDNMTDRGEPNPFLPPPEDKKDTRKALRKSIRGHAALLAALGLGKWATSGGSGGGSGRAPGSTAGTPSVPSVEIFPADDTPAPSVSKPTNINISPNAPSSLVTSDAQRQAIIQQEIARERDNLKTAKSPEDKQRIQNAIAGLNAEIAELDKPPHKREIVPLGPRPAASAPVSTQSTPAEKDAPTILKTELAKAQSRLNAAKSQEEKVQAQSDINAISSELARSGRSQTPAPARATPTPIAAPAPTTIPKPTPTTIPQGADTATPKPAGQGPQPTQGAGTGTSTGTGSGSLPDRKYGLDWDYIEKITPRGGLKERAIKEFESFIQSK